MGGMGMVGPMGGMMGGGGGMGMMPGMMGMIGANGMMGMGGGMDPMMLAMMGGGGAGGMMGMGGGVQLGPDGQPLPGAMFPGMMAPGMLGVGAMGAMVIDPHTGAPMSAAEQARLVSMTAQRLQESDSQLPAILRQIDRLQRTINNQEMRLEGVVIVLRDIECLLRNQQPVIIHQEARPAPRRGNAVMSEAELEQEVKRLLGKAEGRI